MCLPGYITFGTESSIVVCIRSTTQSWQKCLFQCPRASLSFVTTIKKDLVSQKSYTSTKTSVYWCYFGTATSQKMFTTIRGTQIKYGTKISYRFLHCFHWFVFQSAGRSCEKRCRTIITWLVVIYMLSTIFETIVKQVCLKSVNQVASALKKDGK